MSQLFGIPIDSLSNILLIITVVIVSGVLLLALLNRIFFKIGVRNIPRRRGQMLLIIFALMLSTSLLSSMLASGDVISAAVQNVAVYNLGSVDETVSGGHGDLGYFPDWVYYRLSERLQPDNGTIKAMGAGLLEHDILLADMTSRQVRSKVTALAVVPGSETGFGGMVDTHDNHTVLQITDLQQNEVYLNQTLAGLLNARSGDQLYLYSKRWSGQRYPMQVKGIVNNGGLIGETPYLLSNLQTFQTIEKQPGSINQIYVANSGRPDDPLVVSQATFQLNQYITSDVRVDKVKQSGVQFSQNAQEIFTRVFLLFALFALAIGLLLIFLIFVLLAAERRVEMGMARAIGVQRHHLILMFIFEGFVYDLMASFVGLLFGVLLGAALVQILGPILARFGFPLKLILQPHSLIIAYCLGVIFTFLSVLVSSWLISRMTIVDAIRNLPETKQQYTLGEIGARLLVLLGQSGKALWRRRFRRFRNILTEQIPDMGIRLIRMLIVLGFLPLLAGYQLIQYGLESAQIAYFSLGLSLLVIGVGLLLKALVDWGVRIIVRGSRNPKNMAQVRNITSSLCAALVGLSLCAYWALPFDVLAQLGLPRFSGGIEIFFFAGMMMVLGAVWALVANAEILVQPIQTLLSRVAGLNILSRLAASYPLHHRFRTGLSIIMFSLVVFAMTVMSIITNAMQNTYVNINNQTGGYDIQGTAYFKPVADLRASLKQHGVDPAHFSEIGVATSTAVGVIQPSSTTPSWQAYPANIVDGGFLKGLGLHLTARAQGYNSDTAVWQAMQQHPDYALIDSTALANRPEILNPVVNDPNAPLPGDLGASQTPPGFDPSYTFSLNGVYQGDTSFPATPVWVASGSLGTADLLNPLQEDKTVKLTIIGVVDNSDQAHFGLYIPSKNYGAGQTHTQTSEAQTYFFKAAPGQDAHALAQQLGSAFLDNGMETTILEDAIWQTRGPRILLSQVLLGVVGLTLLLGVASLALTGTRAVIERKQQIGMLRAIGCSRRLIQSAFLLESFLVGCVGSLLGVFLGVLLSKNIFAVNFFERYQTGLAFTVPWGQLGIIVGIALLASLLAALLPAWQAGRVSPVEAIRQS